MKYLSISEAAKKFALSERSVRNYCANGRIPGAVMQGKSWLIPEDASKPERSNGKNEELDNLVVELGYELVNFIDKSPVSFFAINNVKDFLLSHGYKELKENKPFVINKGDKVFFIRNGSSIVALDIGEDISKENFAYHIIASHSDSPCFKIKPECDSKSDIYAGYEVQPRGQELWFQGRRHFDRYGETRIQGVWCQPLS